MKLEDFRQQVRAELAAVDPDGAADPAEIDRLVREVIVFGSPGHGALALRFVKADEPPAPAVEVKGQGCCEIP